MSPLPNRTPMIQMLRGISTALVAAAFSATYAVAAGPAITAIQNNSSLISSGLPNYGIAPSSLFVIKGTGLAAPGAPVLQDTVAGLPLTLNGASISVTIGGTTTQPP